MSADIQSSQVPPLISDWGPDQRDATVSGVRGLGPAGGGGALVPPALRGPQPRRRPLPLPSALPWGAGGECGGADVR